MALEAREPVQAWVSPPQPVAAGGDGYKWVAAAYAMNQITEGIIAGAAARRLRRGRLNGLVEQTNAASAYRALTEFATSRLKTGNLLYRAGTSASGLIPKGGLSAGRKVAITVLGVAAMAGMLLAIVHACQTPTLPAFPTR